MFRHFKENLINLITSRLFVLFVLVFAMGMILINRIFALQIVNGAEYLENFKLKIRKERSISSTRGNIYDRNGELLASNELAYSVTIEDVYESGSDKNNNLNATLLKLIHMIEKNGDKIVNDFDIVLDDDGNFAYSVEDTALLRFQEDVYGRKNAEDLKYAEKTATPDDIMNYLAGKDMYGIGGYAKDDAKKDSFIVGEGYTREELLKMVTIRYAMSANSFQKYIPTVVASDVSEKTVAVVKENNTELDGVEISEDTIRKYVDSVYFSHIIGYTGKISQDELDTLTQEDESYSLTDMIGKAGIEQVMETDLQGTKGSEVVYVNNLGKVIETSDRIEPIAGNNLYLTIDKNLQKATYNILEQKIAGILATKIANIKEYTPTENATASNIVIPINDVYYALLNNNVIDINHFGESDAKETEKAVQASFETKKSSVVATLKEELLNGTTPYNAMTAEYQVYETYIVSMLGSANKGVLKESEIDSEDETFQAWKKEEISLKEYLNYCIAMNWIDITKIDLLSQYSDSEEIYDQLVSYIFKNLDNNKDFAKKIYKYMIKEDSLTGKQVCMLLYEQNVIDNIDADRKALESGSVSAYNFLLQRIENLDITPAQLALDPCSGSCVVTDVNTGEVLAMVSYPSYDNNRLANNIDSDYYNELQSDLSLPLWDYATQQRTAPGSTFKMVSATAGLEEGVITTGETITCLGTFDKLAPTLHKCWISPSTHGPLNVTGAIENSCNYFFYEVGYRLSLSNGRYDSNAGLAKLAKYADMYGLSDTSGVEVVESEPNVSDQNSVPSAIGQGNHNYTTVGLARYVTTVANSGTCYNLSLLDKLTDSNGNVLKDFTPTIRNTIDMDQSYWNAIHSGMRKVVENKAYYADLGVDVAGKTGTAQEIKTRANHALFVGYAPYENPEIAFATRIAYGYTSDYAAEVTRDVIKYYFHPEEEDEILTGTAEAPDSTGNGGD